DGPIGRWAVRRERVLERWRRTADGPSAHPPIRPAESPNLHPATVAASSIRLREPGCRSKRFFHHVEDAFGHIAFGQQRQVDLRTVASQNRYAIGRDLESGAGLSGVIQDHVLQRLIL